MDIKSKLTVKVLAVLLLAVGISGFVLGTAFTYQVNQIQARDSFAYKNPVQLDLLKVAPDNSLVTAGWKYLGQAADGRYHYQWIGRNHIMNQGQMWQATLMTGGATGGRLVYIALGTTAYGTQADVSLPGGELVATNGNLQRVSAQATNIGAAGSGSLTMTLIETFTATGAVNGVDLAGLFAGTFTQANSPTLRESSFTLVLAHWAETTFAAVNLASGDFAQLILSNSKLSPLLGLSTLNKCAPINVWWGLG